MEKFKTKSRVLYFLLENLIIIFSLAIIFIIVVILLYYIGTALKNLPILTESLIYSIFISIYLNKDAINGQNILKKKFGFQVTNSFNDRPANPFKCTLRNVFIVLLPIDIFLLTINSDKRFGDYVARTKVTRTNSTEQHKNWLLISFSFLLSIVITCLFFFSILENNQKKRIENYLQENHIKYEQELSNECEQGLLNKAFMKGYSNIKVEIYVKSKDPILNVNVYVEIDNEFNNKTIDSLNSFFMNKLESQKFIGNLEYRYKSTDRKQGILFHID